MTDLSAPQPMAERRQVAALCWRAKQGGAVEVLLVTSRDTGRWVTPKGGRMPGLSDARAAALEALEEAGVEGEVAEAPVGTFRYLKRLKRRAPRPTEVTVFALRVDHELADWKEAAQRTRRWFSVEEAVAVVEETDLQTLIRTFAAAAR